MIALIDYDAGNVRSVEKAFRFLQREVLLTGKRGEILSADAVVLPGVGHFGEAMATLSSCGLTEIIREAIASGKPFLGICLGLQLLFEESEECPGIPGLSVLPGRSERFDEKRYGIKVPQIGWNALSFPKESRLFSGIEEGSEVYFVHSYYAVPEAQNVISAMTTHGLPVTAAVEKDNLFACQFHPEKSGRTGLAILRNFLRIADEEAGIC